MSNIVDEAVKQNWLTVVPSSKFGTPEMAILVIQDADDNIIWNDNEELSQSNFQKAVNQIQARCEVYAVFESTSNYFTVMVRASSVPFAEGQSLGDGSQVAALTTELSNFFGSSVVVWNAEIRSDDVNYD